VKREQQIRTIKESKQVRGTHFLESIKRGKVKRVKERKQVRGTHSLESIEGGTH
jgi:hypothetical protein